MLKIRLARIGKKKQPLYRIIVSESSRDTYGKFLELLGHYNPFSKVCEVKKDRIEYWISKGAKPSPTLHNLLIDQNVITGQKVRAYSNKKKKKGEEEGKKETPAKANEPTKTEEKLKTKPAETPPAAETKPEEKKEKPQPETKPEEKKEAKAAETKDKEQK